MNRINLMSEYDCFRLGRGDYIYDSKNRRVQILNTNGSTYLTQKYVTDDQIHQVYMAPWEIMQKYTIHKKEEL